MIVFFAGSVIYQLEATDNDAGIAGEIHYILADWSKKSGFDVNQTTGRFTVFMAILGKADIFRKLNEHHFNIL